MGRDDEPTPPGQCCQPNPTAKRPASGPSRNRRGPGPALPSLAVTVASCAQAGLSRTFRPSVRAPEAHRSDLTLCQQLLSAVPTQLFNLNKGLSTIHFQSLSVAADNPRRLHGRKSRQRDFRNVRLAPWPQVISGDGGQSGFNVTTSSMRFNSFFWQFTTPTFEMVIRLSGS